MKKIHSNVLMGLACFSIMPSLLLSLPTSPEVVSGSANISVVDQHAMIIEVEDQSIINYKSFNIAAEEMVRFVQPSSSSVVLNRVTGSEGSEILGKMQSNGKVFLVNPNGIFFGQDAQVDMGSLITSTLDIMDSDFLNGNFEFNLSEGEEGAFIVNKGMLRAYGEGSIALISPNVKNEGTIVAHTGKVLLASGEKVVLDFIGDGLMQFSVEGSLEKAMLEQSGSIQALQGQVHLSMSHVKQVIQNVINTDGIQVGSEIVEENGIIRLTSTATISSKVVHVAGREGSKVEVNGDVDASNIEGIGGSIYVFGEQISLESANLNASGTQGGGQILIGGDAFGQGSYFTSQSTKVYSGSILTADAAVLGDGGKIVVWSDGTTYFDGFARAQGSISGGNGGFVETSGKMGLALATGSVDTSAPFGKVGTWLLDPLAIVINNTGTDSLLSARNESDLTSTLTINASIFGSATSNVVLSAMADGGSITVAEDTTISMAPGYGITFAVDAESGEIFLANNSSVATEGGFITFNGKVTLSGDQATLVTNVNDALGSISFSSTLDGTNGFLSNLTLETDSLTFFDTVGVNSALGQLSIESGKFNLGTNIFTKGRSVTVKGATALIGDAHIDSTLGGAYAGEDISFQGEQSTIDGPYKLTVESGVGAIRFDGDVGMTKPLYSFKAKGAQTIVAGSFAADGNTLRYEGPVVLGANVSFTDNGTSGVFFLSTLDSDLSGPWNATVSAPIGTAYFVGAVGATHPLANLTVSSSEIVQVSTVTLLKAGSAAALTYSASVGIAVGGDIIAGSLAFNSQGMLTFNNSVLFAANSGSVATAGTVTLTANSSSVTGAIIAINGVTAGSGNLKIVGDTKTAVTLSNAVLNLVSLNVVADSIIQDLNSAIFATGSITLDASSGASAKTLSTAASITTASGTVTLLGGALVDTISSNIEAGTGNIVLTPKTIPMSYQGVIQITGGNVTFSSGGSVTADLILAGTTKVDVGDGSVTFNKVEGANILTVSGGGVATLSLLNTVGAVTALTGLAADIGQLTQNTTVAVAGNLSYVAPLGITIGGSITTTNSGNVTMVGPVTLTADATIAAGNNISFSGATSTISSPSTARALTLTPGATSIVTLGGAIGTGNPLASLSVTTGSQVNVGSNITVATSGAIAFTPAVVLTGAPTMTSTTGAITFSSFINGAENLNINTGGAVTFGGDIGGINYLSNLNVKAGAIAINSTNINVEGGWTALSGPIALSSNVIFRNNGNGVAFLGAIVGSGSPSLTVNSPIGLIRLGGPISSVGHMTLSGLDIVQVGNIVSAVNANIDFTGLNSILLSANTTVIGTGFIAMHNPITLGTTVTLATAAGAVTLSGVTLGSDGLIIDTITGAINLGFSPCQLSSLTATSSSNGAITQGSGAPIITIGTLNLTSGSGGVTTGSTLISEGGNIILSGGTLDITSNMTARGGDIYLTGASTYHGGAISTGNGNLSVANDLILATTDTFINIGSGTATFNGKIFGNASDTINLSISGTEVGTVNFKDEITSGIGIAYLTALSLEVGHINQVSSVNINGPLLYNAAADISLGGTIFTQAGGSGTIKIIGPITLTNNISIITGSYAQISFVGSRSTIDGQFSLDVAAGNSTIYFDGAIGGINALSSFSTETNANTLISSSIMTTGIQSYGTQSGSGNVVLKGPSRISTVNSDITFFGKINGFQSLYVDAGSGVVTYKAAVGGITPLKSLDTVAGSLILNAPITLR